MLIFARYCRFQCALLGLWLLVSRAWAGVAWNLAPLNARLREADLVVVGRIIAEIDFQSEFLPSKRGTVRVDEALKGQFDQKTLPLIYFDIVGGHYLGQEGIWLLTWDGRLGAYRCHEKADPEPLWSRHQIKQMLEQIARPFIAGPNDGLQLMASPRALPGGRCAISLGLRNGGPDKSLEYAAIEVWVDGRRALRESVVWDSESNVEIVTGSTLWDICRRGGEIIVPESCFSPGQISSVEVHLVGLEDPLVVGPLPFSPTYK